MNTKYITAMELAEYNNCSVQNIRKYFKKKGLNYYLFKDVLDVKHYERFYLFVVPESFNTKENAVQE